MLVLEGDSRADHAAAAAAQARSVNSLAGLPPPLPIAKLAASAGRIAPGARTADTTDLPTMGKLVADVFLAGSGTGLPGLLDCERGAAGSNGCESRADRGLCGLSPEGLLVA